MANLTDQDFLESAVEAAKLGYGEGGLPIGAAIRMNDAIVGTGWNRRQQAKDPVAHAELDCIRRCGTLSKSQYSQCTLYSSLSPCWMCAGAIRLYGIPKVVIADSADGVPGAEVWCATRSFFEDAGIELIAIAHDEMRELFRDFLQRSPELWDGDVGR